MRPEWLKDMPASWGSVPFGSIFTQSKRKNSRLQRDFVLSVMKDRGVIPYTEKGNVGNKVSDDLSGYKLVDKGDFVLNSMNLYMGSVGVSEYDGVTSTAYLVCKPSEEVYSGYYNYLIQFRGFQEYVGFLGKGIMEIREAVRWTALKSVFVPLPDLATQRQIADFLDRETARIDLLIEKKQRLVALLGERFSIFSSSILSRGLVPDGEVVSSESRWFDTLPSDWTLQKLLWLTERIGDGLHSTPNYDDEGEYFFINGNNLSNGKVATKENTRRVDRSEFEKHYIRLDDSTLLLSINGTIGNIALYNGEPVILGKSAAYIRCTDKIIREYLQVVIQSQQIQNYFAFEVTGTTIYNLSLLSIRNMPVPMPHSIEVQRKVVAKVGSEKKRFDTAIEKTLRSIDRLKEYRSALITAAVTGQIDVKTYAKSGAPDRRLEVIQEEMGA